VASKPRASSENFPKCRVYETTFFINTKLLGRGQGVFPLGSSNDHFPKRGFREQGRHPAPFPTPSSFWPHLYFEHFDLSVQVAAFDLQVFSRA
jgi:hypothetical protein